MVLEDAAPEPRLEETGVVRIPVEKDILSVLTMSFISLDVKQIRLLLKSGENCSSSLP